MVGAEIGATAGISENRELPTLFASSRAAEGSRPLEALKRDRKGQHSIRIRDQFRVCFRWTKLGPEDVEIVDYHD
jgi:plasmid maintenance system killer protein